MDIIIGSESTMADTSKKNKKIDDEAPKETTPASTADMKPKKDGTKILVPLVIVAIVMSMGGLGAGGYFLFNQMQTAKAAQAAQEGEEAVPEITETNIYFDEFPEAVVNLQISDKSPFTYLKYAFSVEVEDEKVSEELEVKLSRLKSKVEGVMSNRNWDDISTIEGREALAKEAMAVINEDLPEGKCIGLYFTTFVAQ